MASAIWSLEECRERTRSALESHQTRRAEKLAEHMLSYHPGYLLAKRMLAEARLEQSRVEDAADLFRQVLEGNPEDPQALIGLGIVALDQGRRDDAINLFQRSLDLDPSQRELREQLATLQEEAGGPRPRVATRRDGLARIYLRTNLVAQAIAEYAQIVESREADRPELAVGYAEALWRNHQPSEAAEVCRRLLERSPGCVKANLIMAGTLNQTNPDASQEHWNRAVQADPDGEIAGQVLAVGQIGRAVATQPTVPPLAEDQEQDVVATEPSEQPAADTFWQSLQEEAAAERRPQDITLWLGNLPGEVGGVEGTAVERELEDSGMADSIESLLSPAPGAEDESDAMFAWDMSDAIEGAGSGPEALISDEQAPEGMPEVIDELGERAEPSEAPVGEQPVRPAQTEPISPRPRLHQPWAATDSLLHSTLGVESSEAPTEPLNESRVEEAASWISYEAPGPTAAEPPMGELPVDQEASPDVSAQQPAEQTLSGLDEAGLSQSGAQPPDQPAEGTFPGVPSDMVGEADRTGRDSASNFTMPVDEPAVRAADASAELAQQAGFDPTVPEGELSILDRLARRKAERYGTTELPGQAREETVSQSLPVAPYASPEPPVTPENPVETTPEPEPAPVSEQVAREFSPSMVSQTEELSADAVGEDGQAITDPQAILALAETLWQGGQLDASVKKMRTLVRKQEIGLDMLRPKIETMVAQHPEIGPIHRLLGDVLMKQGMFDRAMSSYRRALECAKDSDTR